MKRNEESKWEVGVKKKSKTRTKKKDIYKEFPNIETSFSIFISNIFINS